MVVPRPLYTCGGFKEDRDPWPSILFFTRGRLGVKLLDAENGVFEEIDDRDVIVGKLEHWELHYYKTHLFPIKIQIHVGS